MSDFKENLNSDSLGFSTSTIRSNDKKSHSEDHTKDELADTEDCTSGVKDLTTDVDVIEKDVQSCEKETTDVEVVDESNVTADLDVSCETCYKTVDSNATLKVADIARETDVKALDSCGITRAENAHREKTVIERNINNPTVDESSCSKNDFNIDLDIKEVEDSICIKKTDFEPLDSSSKCQLKTNTLLLSDELDKARLKDSNATTEDPDVTCETRIEVKESNDIVNAKYASSGKKYLEIDSVDDSNDEDRSFKENADCTVQDPTDTKTNISVTKKGNFSFKIDGSIETNKVKKASASEARDPKKVQLTPKMLKRITTLLLQKSHFSGNDEFYIGDLINAVEGELMGLPKKRKRTRSVKKDRIKHLTKNKIRSINVQRRNICLNMQILSSSMNTELKNLDETPVNLRQASEDFNTEFNQPHTPIGEPNAASLRMDELFLKMKANLPLLQDSYKEVKHCLRLYVRADMTLTDNLHNIVQTYFTDRIKGKHIPRVRYSEVLKTFMNSNRQHCHLDIDANAMDKTSDLSPGDDKI